MAADILAYKATHVPVGEDQKQHLELTRDIAQAFNSMFQVNYFPLPEPQIFGAATRVMSLRDGTKKMSKSDASDYSRLNMTDDADTIAQKLRKAKTDPLPLPATVAGLAARPEASNLVTLYAALSDRTGYDVLTEFEGKGFGDFKPALTDLAVSQLGPIGSEMTRLMADLAEIDRILQDGARRADEIAQPIIAEVKEIVGFSGALIAPATDDLNSSAALPHKGVRPATVSAALAPKGFCDVHSNRRNAEPGDPEISAGTRRRLRRHRRDFRDGDDAAITPGGAAIRYRRRRRGVSGP